SDFLVGIPWGSKHKNLRPFCLELRENETHALLSFGTQKHLKAVFGLLAGRDGPRGFLGERCMAVAGAHLVDGEIDGGAIKPPAYIGADARRKNGSVQFQKSFICYFLGASGIAQHATNQSD